MLMKHSWLIAPLLLVAAGVQAAEPEQASVFVSGRDGYHTYRIPSLLVTKKGTLLAFCEGRKKGGGDAGDIDVLLNRSFDGGKTWEKTRIVWDDGDNTCGNPCPVVDSRTGTIWLLLTHNLGRDTEAMILNGTSKGTRTVWVTKSDDDGATWSKPVEITKDVKKADWTWYATGPGVGIQLKSGRLVVPCDNQVAGSKVQQSHVIFSDDGGKTWKLGGVVGPKCDESQVVKLRDGTLLLNMRSYERGNRRLVAFSKDGGETFSKPIADRQLIEPICQASILRYPGERGGILFSNPASTKREKMTVRLSRDEAKTWSYAGVLHEGPAAYSCLAVLPDGKIACLYERGDKNAYETLTLARFSLSWLEESSQAKDPVRAEQVEVQKIWDKAPHNAFTDLVRFHERWFCVFREGKTHVSPDGAIRVLTSEDGKKWESAVLVRSQSADLRDPKITLTPEGLLQLSAAGALHRPKGHTHQSLVWFSKDGRDWGEPIEVADPNYWLWRVTWHKKTAYGIGYECGKKKEVRLYKSADGRKFEPLVETLLDKGYPNESALVFLPDDTCLCLLRRDEANGLLGSAKPPYKEWTWKDLGRRIGGPNLSRLPDGRIIAVVRLYDRKVRTAVCAVDGDAGKLDELLALPSGGDTSYPGLVWHDGMLWVSYYSSHEERTSIYLAKVRLGPAEKGHLRDAVVPLGSRRELFVDSFLIDSLTGAALTLEQPRDEGIVVRFDKPWEGRFCGYSTVLHDGSLYRLYYRGRPDAGRDGDDQEVTCYAESRDGITWTKPELGLFEVGGSKANNIVLAGMTPYSHNFCPMLDPRKEVPKDQRYKALAGIGRSGLAALVSADGLHWRKLRDEAVLTKGAFDSQNVPFWSEKEQCYLCYFRVFVKGIRRIARATSKDFLHWTEPELMEYGDRPIEHLYTNQTNPYFRAPHLYVGIAARFMPGRQVLSAEQARAIRVDPGYFKDCSDAVLLTTRGGNRFERTFMEGFLCPGIGPENWVSRTNYPALNVVPTGPHEMSFYVNQNYGQPTSHLRRYSLRLDGFACVRAPYGGGELVTKPLTFTGKELSLNFATSAAGGIRIEIQDAAGKPLPGFTLADAVETIGNEIDRTVRWKSGSDISTLAGKPIRLRLVMRDARLYALQFRP
jgi:hypothetical protein